jgi:hypothetical protein
LSPFSATIVQISISLRNDWHGATAGCESRLKTRDGVRRYGGLRSRRDATATLGDFREPEESGAIRDLDF